MLMGSLALMCRYLDVEGEYLTWTCSTGQALYEALPPGLYIGCILGSHRGVDTSSVKGGSLGLRLLGQAGHSLQLGLAICHLLQLSQGRIMVLSRRGCVCCSSCSCLRGCKCMQDTLSLRPGR